MITWRRMLTASISMLTMFLFTPFATVHAASITSGFSATPEQIILQANPGESKPFTIRLVNLHKDISLVLGIAARNFTPNADGTPNITQNQDNPAGLASWIQGPSTFTLSPGINDAYMANVNVPKNAKTGAYYGVELFGIADNKDAPASGVIVIVNVGNTQNDAVIDSLNTSSLQINQQWRASGQVDINVKNTGSGYAAPAKLVLEILDANKNTVESLNADTTTGVLPGAIRTYSVTVGKLLTPNQKYYARASLYVNSTAKPSVTEKELVTPAITLTSKTPAKASPDSKPKPNTFLFVGGGLVALLFILLAVFLEHDQHKKHAQLRESQAKLKLLSEHSPAANIPANEVTDVNSAEQPLQEDPSPVTNPPMSAVATTQTPEEQVEVEPSTGTPNPPANV